MKRKFIVIGIGGALVLGIIVLALSQNTKRELRGSSKLHFATEEGKLVFVPTNNYWKVTFVYNGAKIGTNTTAVPAKP